VLLEQVDHRCRDDLPYRRDHQLEVGAHDPHPDLVHERELGQFHVLDRPPGRFECRAGVVHRPGDRRVDDTEGRCIDDRGHSSRWRRARDRHVDARGRAPVRPVEQLQGKAQIGDRAGDRAVRRHELAAHGRVDRTDRPGGRDPSHRRTEPHDTAAERRVAQRTSDVVAETQR
jgi:hypothetical protein